MALFTGGKKLEKLTQDNEKLTKEVAKLKQLHDKISRESSELRMEKGNLLIDIETLRSQLNTFMEKYVDVEELEKRAEELKSEISHLESGGHVPAEATIAYDEIPVHLRSEIEELERRRAALQTEINTKEAYLEKLNQQFDLLEQATLNAAPVAPAQIADLSELNSEQETLQEIILDLRRSKHELEAEIAELQSQKSSFEMPHFTPYVTEPEPVSVVDNSEELFQLRTQLEEKELQLNHLQQQLSEELADRNLEISSLRSQLEERDRKIASMGLDGISIEPFESPELPSYLTGESTPEPVSETPAFDRSELDEIISQKDLQIDNLQETIASLHQEIESLQELILTMEEEKSKTEMQEVDFEAPVGDEVNPPVETSEFALPEVESTLPPSEETVMDENTFQMPGFDGTTPPEFPEGFDSEQTAAFMEQFEAEMENIKQLRLAHDTLQEENSELVARLTESESHLITANKLLTDLQQENERLNQEVEALIEEVDALKSQSAQMYQPEHAPSSFDEKEKILSDYLEKREKLSSEVSSLKSEIDRLSSLAKAQNDELNSMNEELQSLQEKRSEALLNLQQFEEKKSLLTKEVMELENTKLSVAGEVTNLNDTLSDLESSSKVLEEKQLKTEELVLEALRSFNQEIVSLREHQTKLRTDIMEKERLKSQKESDIEQLDLQLGELKSEIKIAEKDLTNIRQHIHSLKEEKDQLNKNLFELKDTEKRMNLIVQELKKNRENLKEENNELERKLSSMFNSFSKRHADLEGRRASLETAIKERQSDLTNLQDEIENGSIMLNRVKSELQSLEHQKNDLVNSIEKLKKIEKEAHDSNNEF